MPESDGAKRKAFDGGAIRVEPYKSLDVMLELRSDYPVSPVDCGGPLLQLIGGGA